ncbi:hypothetical protein ADUPG1_006512 [Aduncisulcus paluster]|uniref:RETREG1-3/ARL6IP-like N-terminal reticulon-homology domain-containing protein n=1 Tax=Aduncisulcus paluster TaxID=2918883 RepID=A0ABQ5KII8_9EUKA|nr:hypothetical protein ADUPG1_006512 [Aduncisulcus paluster]
MKGIKQIDLPNVEKQRQEEERQMEEERQYAEDEDEEASQSKPVMLPAQLSYDRLCEGLVSVYSTAIISSANMKSLKQNKPKRFRLIAGATLIFALIFTYKVSMSALFLLMSISLCLLPPIFAYKLPHKAMDALKPTFRKGIQYMKYLAEKFGNKAKDTIKRKFHKEHLEDIDENQEQEEEEHAEMEQPSPGEQQEQIKKKVAEKFQEEYDLESSSSVADEEEADRGRWGAQKEVIEEESNEMEERVAGAGI